MSVGALQVPVTSAIRSIFVFGSIRWEIVMRLTVSLDGTPPSSGMRVNLRRIAATRQETRPKYFPLLAIWTGVQDVTRAGLMAINPPSIAA